jgi:hypothetical protein
MSEWYFKPYQEGDDIRDPIHGEFFSVDAISNPGTALVREGIQNSLDKASGEEPVIVRIYLSGQSGSLKFSNVKKYFEGAWDHYLAENNGIHPNQVPTLEEKCNFITFEDFSTTGVEGDVSQPFKPKNDEKNNFYHFFRAEGQTDKTETELGSWGVGKFVFYRASRINSILCFTVRESDSKKLLLGKTILKAHYHGEDYCQNGYYGLPPNENSKLVMPIRDEEETKEFSNLFNLQRSNNDPGLSIVIPWHDPEITEQDIISAVLNDYFYPILIGKLEVIVETPNIKVWLNKDDLFEELDKIETEVISDLKPIIELTGWHLNLFSEDRFLLNKPDENYAWKWSKSIIPENILEEVKEIYFEGKEIAFRIPITVRKKNGESNETFFDVCMVRDNRESLGRPTFIREDLIIPRVNSPRTRGVRAVVIAHDKHISKFLRKAENPSHTEWNHYKLKDEYQIGYKTDLEFVKRSVFEIVKIISESEHEEDKTLLSDFFSIPASLTEVKPVESTTAQEDDDEGHETTEPNLEIPRQSKRFRIIENASGFSIVPGDNPSYPKLLDIQIAYDTRKGSPLKKYNGADFQVDKKPIMFEPSSTNVRVREHYNNKILIEILDKDFAFHLTGFDRKRQIFVKAQPLGEENGDT